MGTTKKSKFKTDNGVDFDIHYFETSADQVTGTIVNVEDLDLVTEPGALVDAMVVRELNSKLKLDYENSQELKSRFTAVNSAYTAQKRGRIKFTFYNGSTTAAGMYIKSSLKGDLVVTSVLTHSSGTTWYEIDAGETLTVTLKDTNISCSSALFYPYMI